ncbi:MAG: transposase [Actinobacteria bacterium]|nr:transposase [Actinomycetota bacterium]
MRPAQLAEVRADLLAFAAEMFGSLPRCDQRRWAETYLRGLMLDGRRKSIEPLAAGAEATSDIAWREGTRGTMRERFLARRCRPANIGLRRFHRSELPLAWLLAQWPEGESEPTKYWLADLPAETTLFDLVRLAKLRWRIEQDYRELKDALGLDHFEGRSFRGWHHHVTLVSLAHGFLTLQRLSPKADAPA